MRAMPSPTSSTRPTSRASSLARYWSISSRRTETISSALNLITASRDNLFADVGQLRTHRLVVDPVADADDQAPQQIRIDPSLEDRLLVELLPQLLAQPFAQIVGQRHRAGDLDAHASG